MDVRTARATGIRALDTRTGAVEEYACRHLILATGGAGQLYRVTTNPAVATGDGIALAYRAGAEVMDMEFVQFHPTALRLPGVQPFLISEAVRGEGGVLRNARASASCPSTTRRPSWRRATSSRAPSSTRDAGDRRGPRAARRHAPRADRTCARASRRSTASASTHGLDITREPIPVSPAAHYMMGGVRTNTWGETTLPRPLRLRRVRLHRRTRREPPRVQLAAGDGGLREARGPAHAGVAGNGSSAADAPMRWAERAAGGGSRAGHAREACRR